MKSSSPYQPFLLRLLHGFTSLFLLAAMVTAFWTYDTYDGRWGKTALPHFIEIESIHGTFGLYTLLMFPLLVLYAFHRGQKRLIQPDTLTRLTQVGHPIWWYTFNRVTNTLALLALTFALFSGKMMDDQWLPRGELNHFWYYAHLVSWMVMIFAIAFHLLMNARVGGSSLLLSMWHWKYRLKDSPRFWWFHFSQWRTNLELDKMRFSLLNILEAIILISIISAWLIPLLK
ncbi:cytochrome b/b6 domain-containing protein [Chroococcus sp. FPU101]|uniref:cytochrome b/b6 domain-containing protein n=1 Tax=Chroococcus sp. FPU101 TaxID=1974212 RepID=UPI001A8CFB53|nr:cytochrome b/b6 domain-containing protein [Chroococcus sp. FPU101]GFE69145.1 hypothetical protein CFPU101_17550 [Chroococcus sp. FPU101]